MPVRGLVRPGRARGSQGRTGVPHQQTSATGDHTAGGVTVAGVEEHNGLRFIETPRERQQQGWGQAHGRVDTHLGAA